MFCSWNPTRIHHNTIWIPMLLKALWATHTEGLIQTESILHDVIQIQDNCQYPIQCNYVCKPKPRITDNRIDSLILIIILIVILIIIIMSCLQLHKENVCNLYGCMATSCGHCAVDHIWSQIWLKGACTSTACADCMCLTLPHGGATSSVKCVCHLFVKEMTELTDKANKSQYILLLMISANNNHCVIRPYLYCKSTLFNNLSTEVTSLVMVT